MKPRRGKKLGVWLSVIGVVALLGAHALLYGWTHWMFGLPRPVFLGLEGVLIASAVAVFIAARARIREINGGEENDLSQY